MHLTIKETEEIHEHQQLDCHVSYVDLGRKSFMKAHELYKVLMELMELSAWSFYFYYLIC